MRFFKNKISTYIIKNVDKHHNRLPLWHGFRSYLRFNESNTEIQFGYNLLPKLYILSLSLEGGGDACIHAYFACGLFSLSLSLDHHKISHFLYTHQINREIGVSFYAGTMWVKLWHNIDGWHNTDPKWWSFSISPLDALFGCYEHKKISETSPVDIVIPLPERAYKAKANFETWQSGRKKLPWKKKNVGIDIDMKLDPLPIPGKGDNSWDCDDDALTGIYILGDSMPNAIGRAVTNVLETREKYASIDWTPTPPSILKGRTDITQNFKYDLIHEQVGKDATI